LRRKTEPLRVPVVFLEGMAVASKMAVEWFSNALTMAVACLAILVAVGRFGGQPLRAEETSRCDAVVKHDIRQNSHVVVYKRALSWLPLKTE
jgi:hypothetical protein